MKSAIGDNASIAFGEQTLPKRSISVLVHEIRNPLTNINLSLHILKSGISDDRLIPFLNIIDRSSERIDELLKKLLDFRETDEPTEQYNAVYQLLDAALALTADRILLKQVKVNKNYDKQRCAIILNRSQICFAITNIIINAIDAMPTDNGKLSLLTKTIDEVYIIQIEDNGCGISKDDLKNIFSPFFTKRPGGLGLGLAVAYDILISNHVKVKVESELLKGTRFILLFKKPFFIVPEIAD